MSRSPRVLVVEDDAEIAGALRRSLRIEGYDVRVAGDGDEALSESGLFEPDLVVLDLGLPRIDGIEVAERLREKGDVPILMLTARDGVQDRVRGLDSGADDYLVKPLEREELLARGRLPREAVRPRGAARADARPAAPPASARQRFPAGRRPRAQSRHARGAARRARHPADGA